MELTTVETAKKLGLTAGEFEKIKEILGRVPNFTELSVYSVMWSEHCSYKNSIVWLKTLPRDSEKMLAKAGDENAGLVDIGDGLAVCFKIESHNHPSALEPFQGAATGVGGINRDIFSMGARPIAQLNSLRFGNIQSAKTKWLVKGVVSGISSYGNAFGIPTVGGEVYFDDCYNVNPLVNAFSAGVVDVNKVARATSYGAGNPVFIVGSATGKDGIHGAAFASKDITEDSIKDLPAVQVGDPFLEKLLLEATLEIIETETVIGVQDMGAAGITCSTSEMSAKGEHGMDIWLEKVPMRQENMLSWEILLSESQERMLFVVKKGTEATIKAICDKWDIFCEQIGVVTESKNVRYFYHGKLHADIPAESLVLGGGAPVYHREYKEPAYYAQYKMFRMEDVPRPSKGGFAEVAQFLLSHPNIASRRWISEQYDSMVGAANATTNAPSDAAVVNIKGTNKNLVITVDCNSRYVYADPEIGAQIAVSEAARNIICTGGEPVGITNCLNFGNPYVPEVYWHFVGAIKGMKKACEKFGTPVTGGNVSFYNQSSDEGPVFPTPTIGMVGILEGLEKRMTLNFKNEDDVIYMVGKPGDDIACSEYLYSWHCVKASPPPLFDLDEELRVQNAVKVLIQKGLINSAHDVSDGGLFITLAESALSGGLGFFITTNPGYRKDAFLFGESQSRVVVSVRPNLRGDFEATLKNLAVEFSNLGVVTNKNSGFNADGYELSTYEKAHQLYFNAIGTLMA
jgi:phosphoribosylformylglycinamidine synthase